MVSHLSSLNSLFTFFFYLYIYIFYIFKLVKIGCKIKSVIEMNFKNLLVKIVNLIFKYILNNYFIKYDWR